jgi:hypothetical protein
MHFGDKNKGVKGARGWNYERTVELDINIATYEGWKTSVGYTNTKAKNWTVFQHFKISVIFVLYSSLVGKLT